MLKLYENLIKNKIQNVPENTREKLCAAFKEASFLVVFLPMGVAGGIAGMMVTAAVAGIQIGSGDALAMGSLAGTASLILAERPMGWIARSCDRFFGLGR